MLFLHILKINASFPLNRESNCLVKACWLHTLRINATTKVWHCQIERHSSASETFLTGQVDLCHLYHCYVTFHL